MRPNGGDRGARAQRFLLLSNGALLALLYFGLSSHEITFYSAIRAAGFEPKAAATLISLALLGPFLSLPIVKVLERRSTARWADPLVAIAVANFMGFQLLASALERLANSSRDRAFLGLLIVAMSVLNSLAMAFVTSQALGSVGGLRYGKIRVAGTLGFIAACLACEFIDPRRMASLAFLAIAALQFHSPRPLRTGERRILDSISPGRPKHAAGSAMLLALALAMAATSRPFEAAGYAFMATLVDRPGIALIVAVSLELWILTRWAPRRQAKRGGTGGILLGGGAAWFLIYATFAVACLSGAAWISIAVMALQGFNAASQTAVQTALGSGARAQAAVLVAAAVGRLGGNVLLGAFAPPEGGGSSAYAALWTLSASLGLATCLVALLTDRVLLSTSDGPKDRADLAVQSVGTSQVSNI